jgi:hypothetical protein
MLEKNLATAHPILSKAFSSQVNNFAAFHEQLPLYGAIKPSLF